MSEYIGMLSGKGCLVPFSLSHTRGLISRIQQRHLRQKTLSATQAPSTVSTRFERERVIAPQSRNRRIWRIVLIGFFLLICAGLILKFVLPVFFSQGSGITNCQVGTGYAISTGSLQQVSNSFPDDTILYLVCQVSARLDARSIADKIVSSQTDFRVIHPGAVDQDNGTYVSSALFNDAGSYTWNIAYQRQQVASVTFEINS